MKSSQILLTFTVLMTRSVSGLHVTPTGGYSDILVKIEDGVHSCNVVVDNLKKFLTSSSDALDSALSGEKSQNDIFQRIFPLLLTLVRWEFILLLSVQISDSLARKNIWSIGGEKSIFTVRHKIFGAQENILWLNIFWVIDDQMADNGLQAWLVWAGLLNW